MKRRTTEGAEASNQAWSALIIGFCMLILAGQSYGQGNIDLRAIVYETQKMSQPPEMTLVWWLPEQSWQASPGQDPTTTKAKSISFLRSYVHTTLLGFEHAPKN